MTDVDITNSSDLYKSLADDNIFFLSDQITDRAATDLVALLMLKSLQNPKEIFTIYLNSSGGDIANILMIYDVFKSIKNKVEVICLGEVTDEAVILLAGASPGYRGASKNSFISIAQLNNHYTTVSDMTDAKINLDQAMEFNKKMMEILAKCTKKPLKTILKDFDRSVQFSPTQALKYGLIDYIL